MDRGSSAHEQKIYASCTLHIVKGYILHSDFSKTNSRHRPRFFPLQITLFSTNFKTRRRPYRLSKLVSHGINCFGTHFLTHFSRKKKKKPGIFAENIDDPQRFMDDHKMVFCTPLNKFCQITRKSWLWYYYEVPQSRLPIHSLPRKC